MTKKKQPWFDLESKSLLRETRKLERIYRKDKQPINLETWKQSLTQLTNTLKEKESAFWKKQVMLSQGNPKVLWTKINSLLHRKENFQSNPQFSADEFRDQITHKINNLKNNMINPPKPTFSTTEHSLKTFQIITEDELRKQILSAPPKSCSLDILPVHILQQYTEELLPFLLTLINKSLSTGIFPSKLKEGIIHPKIKNQNIMKDDPTNYRPITNIPFLAKILERIANDQLLTYLNIYNLLPTCQSGFRKFYSTETLLLDLCSQIINAQDEGKLSILALLDVSAAFDTVDHDILLERLHKSFGLTGQVLNWIKSYLTDRSSDIEIPGYQKAKLILNYGVPQGSILGPLLYILYTSDLFNLPIQSNLSTKCYADDTQILKTTDSKDLSAALMDLKSYITEIANWMESNALSLNLAKTQLIIIGTEQRLKQINWPTLYNYWKDTPLNDAVKNLGIKFDSKLNLEDQILALSKASLYHLHQLRQIRNSIDEETATLIAHAFVVSKLEYCASLYTGLPSSLINILQRILRMAARFVLNKRKFDPILSDMLEQLHWLPFPERLQYRTIMLVRSCLEGTAPQYLKDRIVLISQLENMPKLRSTTNQKLQVPRHKLARKKNRDFSIVGPNLWNNLPEDIRTLPLNKDYRTLFAKSLKTHLFQIALSRTGQKRF